MKRGRRISDIPKQQIKAEKLYLDGVKKRHIAASVGVSLMTLYRWIKKYGWEEAYRQKYEEDLNKIEDEMEKLIYMGTHRPLKEKKNKGIVKNREGTFTQDIPQLSLKN